MFGIATILVVVAVLAAIASTVFSIWLVAIAFRRHVLWGLASLFLPFAVIVFAIKHWDESRKPFLYSLATGVAASFFFIAAAVVGAGAASKHLSEGLNEDLAQEMARVQAAMEAQAAGQPSGDPAQASVQEPRTDDARRDDAEAPPLPIALPPPATGPNVKESRDGFTYDPADVTRDGYVAVPLRDAGRAVGRFAKVVETDGQSHRGELVRADAGGVELQRFLGGGTVSYRVSGKRIETLLIDVRN
jgi:hypothetical protein